jgi:hypothetical protein
MPVESRDAGTQLIEALLDAMTLEWKDRGGLSADAVRNVCTALVARGMGVTTDEVTRIVQDRIQDGTKTE